MFLKRLEEHRNNLTHKDELISNLLLEFYKTDNFHEMLTSDEIADVVGCGQSTVIRFSQKLGYSSFKSMMLDVVNESLMHNNHFIEENESFSHTKTKMRNLYDISIEEVSRINSSALFENTSYLLYKAKSIYFYGVRGSKSVVELLYYRLLETGKDVFFPNNELEAISTIRNYDENDVLFVVSSSGETEEMLEIVNIALRNKLKIISITGSEFNTLYKMSNISFKTSEHYLHTNRFNLVNRAPYVYLIDCIFVKMWRDYEAEMIDGIDNFKKDYTRIEAEENDLYRM